MISLWKGLEALSPASRPSSSTTAMWRRWQWHGPSGRVT